MTTYEIEVLAEKVAAIVLKKLENPVHEKPQQKLIKVNEAAKLISMSPQTIRRYIDDIPHVQKGKKCSILFRPQDVIEWAATR